MTAVTLRQAATTLRALAEAATPGPWESFPAPSISQGRGGEWAVWSSAAGRAKVLTEHDHDAEYIATMHPFVGLAVADLLDGWADDLDRYGGKTSSDDRALNLARAVLGSNQGDPA